MSDSLLFLRQLISRPLQVSAMAPSSRFLGKAMAKDLGPHTGRVVEFGPGTGRLTKGILDAGVAPENLTLFEMNPEFVTHLRAQFPGVTVHLAGAQDAPQMVEKGVGAVISGVPLLSMPMALRRTIMDGVYVQFTYRGRPALEESQIKSLGLIWKQTAYVPLNLPPARVHTFRRA
jgi:phosphatidylethanolamine/phosphatidyl-N-methylethanolamine N-methyltransferase